MTTGPVLDFLSQAVADYQTPEKQAAATHSSVAIDRYVAGMTDEARLRGELEALGYAGHVQDRLVLAAKLSKGLDHFKSQLALWEREAKDAKITHSDYATLLENAGLSQEDVAQAVQLLEAQKPPATAVNTDVGLTVLQAEELPTRATGTPTTVSLVVLEASEVPQGAREVSNVDVGLVVLEVSAVPAKGPETPTQITLSILEAEAV